MSAERSAMKTHRPARAHGARGGGAVDSRLLRGSDAAHDLDPGALSRWLNDVRDKAPAVYEVYGRILRGDDREHIMSVLGKSRSTVDQYVKRARERIPDGLMFAIAIRRGKLPDEARRSPRARRKRQSAFINPVPDSVRIAEETPNHTVLDHYVVKGTGSIPRTVWYPGIEEKVRAQAADAKKFRKAKADAARDHIEPELRRRYEHNRGRVQTDDELDVRLFVVHV